MESLNPRPENREGIRSITSPGLNPLDWGVLIRRDDGRLGLEPVSDLQR